MSASLIALVIKVADKFGMLTGLGRFCTDSNTVSTADVVAPSPSPMPSPASPLVTGKPCVIDNTMLSCTPAVPRSSRLSSNLVTCVAKLVRVCPELYPTNAPAATCS